MSTALITIDRAMNDIKKIVEDLNQFFKMHPRRNQTSLSITELTILLHFFGFNLIKLEKEQDPSNPDLQLDGLRLQVKCAKSGTVAEYSKTHETCNCLTGSNKICNLPPSATDTTDTCGHLGTLLAGLNLNCNDVNLANPSSAVGENQATSSDWEVDPNTTPPGKTSSPITELTRLLASSTNNSTVMKNLFQIKNLVDVVLDEVGKAENNDKTGTTVTKRVSDIKPPEEAAARPNVIQTPPLVRKPSSLKKPVLRKEIFQRKYNSPTTEKGLFLQRSPKEVLSPAKKKVFDAKSKKDGKIVSGIPRKF